MPGPAGEGSRLESPGTLPVTLDRVAGGAMADGKGGGISGVFLGALLLVAALTYVGCQDEPAASGASGTLSSGAQVINDEPDLARVPGQDVAAQGVRVQHVAADEGFWVDLAGGRVWVTLTGPGESPYTVRDGDVVSFQGRVIAHNGDYPNGLGMCSQGDYDALAAQTTHIEVPMSSLSFGVG
jgi:hypothetical protein